MQAAEAWAATRGRPFITLETGAANTPARAFYAALGFTEEGIRLTKPVTAPGALAPELVHRPGGSSSGGQSW